MNRFSCLVAALGVIAVLGACSADSGAGHEASADASADSSAKGSMQPQLGGPPTQAGSTGPVTMLLRDAAGKPVAGASIAWKVTLGGGQVAQGQSSSDAAGLAKADWTLGPAPVLQRLSAIVAAGPLAGVGASLQVHAALAAPVTATSWGDVEAALAAAKIDGSTEDLAFGPDGLLHLGVPGGLLTVDASGKAAVRTLSGDPVVQALGLAFDAGGTLWLADSKGKALRKVAANGAVTTALTKVGEVALAMPNDVAIDAQGRVWLSDPCAGLLLRFDPKSGQVDRQYSFDAASHGGPNGLAVAADGTVWMTTENVGLLCGKSVPLQAPVAGLWSLSPATAEAKPQLVKGEMGLFGDGLTFDAEGNLYAIFDREKDFALTESTVWLFGAEARAGKAEPVRFVSAPDRIFANAVFPPASAAAFGPTRLYLALLAVPPFTSARGVARVEVGISGP